MKKLLLMKFKYPMKFSLLTTILSVFAITLFMLSSCGGMEVSLSAADRAFEAKKFFLAKDMYRKSASQAKTRQERAFVTYKVGKCYENMLDYTNAERWYERAIRTGLDTAVGYLRLALAQKHLEDYEQARENFSQYLALVPDDSLANAELKSTELAIEYMEKPRYYDVYNENTLNTRASEFSPSFYKNGLLFTSTREPVKGKNVFEWTGTGYLNIYSAELTDRGRWTKPALITKKEITTPFNEGSACYNSVTNTIYFTQCNGKKGKDAGCKIFASQYKGETWNEPFQLKLGPDSFTYGHPSLTADGNRIFFASDKEGGFGGNDIYYADRVSDSIWSEAVNVGKEVNTPGREVFPFIHPDGTLYFSSDGHLGMGGLDIYSATLKDDGTYKFWENLKFPINSSADDFGLILDLTKDEGYLSSNRIDGRGSDDIYAAVLMLMNFNLTGIVYNSFTEEPIPDAIITLNDGENEPYGVKTDATGTFVYDMSLDKTYNVTAAKKDFFGDKGTVNTLGLRESEDFALEFYLEPIPSREIVLEGILYDLNKAELREESKRILDSLFITLIENPSLKIEVAAHTDSRSDSAYNLDLSQRRAESVYNYLTLEKGLDTARLEAKGYGETLLLNKCADGVKCTEEEHQRNRRTTFKVLAQDFEIEEKIEEAPGKTRYRIR
jgi:peptidoglycan-associated lipoprotein